MYCSSPVLVESLKPMLLKAGYAAIGVEKVEDILDNIVLKKIDILILERYFAISSVNEINVLVKKIKNVDDSILVYIVDDSKMSFDEDEITADRYIDSFEIAEVLGA